MEKARIVQRLNDPLVKLRMNQSSKTRLARLLDFEPDWIRNIEHDTQVFHILKYPKLIHSRHPYRLSHNDLLSL